MFNYIYIFMFASIFVWTKKNIYLLQNADISEIIKLLESSLSSDKSMYLAMIGLAIGGVSYVVSPIYSSLSAEDLIVNRLDEASVSLRSLMTMRARLQELLSEMGYDRNIPGFEPTQEIRDLISSIRQSADSLSNFMNSLSSDIQSLGVISHDFIVIRYNAYFRIFEWIVEYMNSLV